MPYISQPSRAGLDAHIDALANEIRALAKSEGHDAAFCGPLNYACTKLALQVIPVRRYWTIALVVGVFKNIADEFYRRYAVPYEDEKIAEHGDVYGDFVDTVEPSEGNHPLKAPSC